MADRNSAINGGRRMLIAASEIKVDPVYQRGLDPGFVRRLMRKWKDHRCGLISVERRSDGSLWVYDGQHRLAAIAAIYGGDALVECSVIDSAGPSTGAMEFGELNETRRAPNVRDRYVAGCAAGNPAWIAIKEAMDSVGRDPVVSSKASSFYGLARLHKVARTTPERIMEIVIVAHAIAGDSPVLAATVSGVCSILGACYYHGIDTRRPIQKLAQRGQVKLMAEAETLAIKTRSTPVGTMPHEMLRIVNQRTRTGSRNHLPGLLPNGAKPKWPCDAARQEG